MLFADFVVKGVFIRQPQPSGCVEVIVGKVVINVEYCKGCELCTTACAKKLLRIGSSFNKSGYYAVEYCGKEDECTGCALCAEMCPDVAIEVWK